MTISLLKWLDIEIEINRRYPGECRIELLKNQYVGSKVRFMTKVDTQG